MQDKHDVAAAREPIELTKSAEGHAAAIAVACLLIAIVVVGFVLIAIGA